MNYVTRIYNLRAGTTKEQKMLRRRDAVTIGQLDAREERLTPVAADGPRAREAHARRPLVFERRRAVRAGRPGRARHRRRVNPVLGVLLRAQTDDRLLRLDGRFHIMIPLEKPFELCLPGLFLLLASRLDSF